MTKESSDKEHASGSFERYSSMMAGSRARTALERYRSLMVDNQIGTALERYQSLMVDGQIGKALERHQSLMAGGQIGTALERYQSMMVDNQIGTALERYQSMMAGGQIGKALGRYQSLMAGGQFGRALEQYRSLVQGLQIGEVLENWEALTAESGKLVAPVWTDGALSSQVLAESTRRTIEALVDELKARDTRTEDEIDTDEDKLPNAVELGGSASSTLNISTYFEGHVEQPVAQGLSAIPTWALVTWLYFLLPMLALICKWEDARQGIVDMNARLPQTDSFYEVRNFIRIQLAGRPGDFRLVNGSKVNLREGPGMKSEVILQLPKNAPVAVLGKEDRTWVFVSYEHEGYPIEGYVSGKFLKRVRRQ